ncbi:MAG: cellulase family glycosylhydrolase [bacterium]|nr:cellulase family glycosylhydrolase [bacterium]
MGKVAYLLAGMLLAVVSVFAEQPGPRDEMRGPRIRTLASRPLPAGFIFGANTHGVTDSALDRMLEINMKWARLDMSWSMVEPVLTEPPTYRWEVPDAVVAAYGSRGIKMHWILGYTPAWASVSGAMSAVPKDANAVEHFRKFVRALAERYRYDVNYYSVWNEPNGLVYWEGSVDEYIDYLLVPAWEEIKAVDPSKKLVGPDLALLGSPHITIEDFFAGLDKRNAGQYFDIIAQHAYADTPADILEIFEDGSFAIDFWFIQLFKTHEALLKIFDGTTGLKGKPVWLTEFGWRSDKVGEKRQANYIVETLHLISGNPRFQNAFIYDIRDDPNHPRKFGMLRSDGTPKKVYDKLRNVFVQSAQVLYENDEVDFNEQGTVINEPEDRRERVYIDKDPRNQKRKEK